MQTNIAAGARRINIDILFTNRKLPTIHSESAPRSSSKASTYSFADKEPGKQEKEHSKEPLVNTNPCFTDPANDS